MDRGGRTVVEEMKRPQQVTWNRVRDDISDATVTLAGQSCRDNSELLDKLRTGRMEMRIYRGSENVWEGPLTLLSYGRETAQVTARDVMHYAARTVMHSNYTNAYPNVGTVVARAAYILNHELNRKEALSPPINVLPYLTEHHFAGEARTSAVTQKYQDFVWNHIDSLAEDSGMDYTVLGRAIHLWDTSNPIGYTPRVSQKDFLGDIAVTEYGLDLATRYVVTNGQGVYGVYPSATNIDPYYGEWEMLSNPYDETDTGSNSTANEMASQAKSNLLGRNPAPVLVRVPDGSSLDPRGALQMKHLVPGVFVPLEASLTARKIVQMQKLDKVVVTETPEGETINVTLSTAPRADA